MSVNEDETASTASSSVNISLSSNDISPVSLDNSDHSDESVTSEGRIEFTDLSSEEFQEPQSKFIGGRQLFWHDNDNHFKLHR